MHALPLVGHVEILVGVIVLLPLYDGREVRRGVKIGAVRFLHEAGRNFLRIALLRNVDDHRPFALPEDPLLSEVLHHRGDVRLRVTFAFPEVKGHVQVAVVLLQIGHGHVHDVAVEGIIAGIAVLQAVGRFMRPRRKGLIRLGASARRRVDLLEIADGKGCFGRIGAFVLRIKVRQVRLPVLQFLDDESHLQAPVAEMHVADRMEAEEAADALQRLADDRGAQMPHVKGLRHVGAAVVEDDGLPFADRFRTEADVSFPRVQVSCHGFRRERQVDEAGPHRFRCRKERILLQDPCDLFRDLERIAVKLLSRRHRAVALIFAQIGAVRQIDLAESGIHPAAFKGLRRRCRHLLQ